LATIASSNPNGASVRHSYYDLNRLSVVTNNRLNATTTYANDAANNLDKATYPNGVTSIFSFDSLDRVSTLSSQVSSYTYQRGAVGNLTAVSEPSGRSVQWSYGSVNHLTGETIASDPAKKKGSVR
jgi:YD repeat-containing protein